VYVLVPFADGRYCLLLLDVTGEDGKFVPPEKLSPCVSCLKPCSDYSQRFSCGDPPEPGITVEKKGRWTKRLKNIMYMFTGEPTGVSVDAHLFVNTVTCCLCDYSCSVVG